LSEHLALGNLKKADELETFHDRLGLMSTEILLVGGGERLEARKEQFDVVLSARDGRGASSPRLLGFAVVDLSVLINVNVGDKIFSVEQQQR
jgi:hypothetical protein